jgi:hypothetical protein
MQEDLKTPPRQKEELMKLSTEKKWEWMLQHKDIVCIICCWLIVVCV